MTACRVVGTRGGAVCFLLVSPGFLIGNNLMKAQVTPDLVSMPLTQAQAARASKASTWVSIADLVAIYSTKAL